MNKEWEHRNDWCNSYLDTMENLYGPFELQPDLTIDEQAEEWKENFREDGQVQIQMKQQQSLMEFAEAYLDTLEDLYGDFNLHPWLTIQEVAEEWRKCFMSDVMQLQVSPQKSIYKPLKTAS